MRLAILLDITGSMGQQLQGAKQTLSGLVALVSDMDVEIVIIPFTETSHVSKVQISGCLASLHHFVNDSAGASKFIDGLKLCKSPLAPEINASGEDGPENSKAAIHLLTDLQPMPTIAFLVTDAPPHKHGDNSPTARGELEWLKKRGLTGDVRTDVFQVFHSVTEHYEGMLIFNSVIYGGGEAHDIYGRLASMTGGMLMRPNQSDAGTMSRGLLAVCRSLIERMSGEVHPVSEIPGFTLYDIDDIEQVDFEHEISSNGVIQPGDSKKIFASSMERAAMVVGGKKWAKRQMGMSAGVEQMRFVWLAAKYLTSTPAERSEVAFAEIVDLMVEIMEKIPEEQRGHFSISIDDLENHIRSPDLETEDAAESIITLDTVGDALGADADPKDWLATVMRLLMGYPAQIQLPLDLNGNPDFMDAWASVCERLGSDRMTAADFAMMVKDGEDGSMVGPTDRKKYNNFLAMIPKADKLATLVFWLMSGTQLLNVIQGVTMGAKGFLPNLYAGTAAACLTRMIMSNQPISEFGLNQMAQLVNSIRHLHRTPGKTMAAKLRDGQANPSDHMSKFVCVLARMDTNEPAFNSSLRLVLEEWLAVLVQRHYGRRTPETDAAYLASLQEYFPTDDVIVGGMDIDPLEVIHALERTPLEDLPEECLKTGWEQRAVCRLRSHPVYRHFNTHFRLLSAALLGTTIEVDDVWENWEQSFLRLLLLRLRTARFVSTFEGVSKVVTFEMKTDVKNCRTLVVERLYEANQERLNKFNLARKRACEDAAMAAVVRYLKTCEHRKSDDAITAGLANIFVSLDKTAPDHTTRRPAGFPQGPTAVLLGTSVKIGRMHVPQIVKALQKQKKREQVMSALIFGEWTTEPCQCLKKSGKWLIEQVTSAELKSKLDTQLKGASICGRKEGYNRLGHSSTCVYPGPMGWTFEYGAERTSARPQKTKYVNKMQEYAQFAQWALAMAKSKVSHALQVQIQTDIEMYEDANMLSIVQSKVESKLGCGYSLLDSNVQYPPL